MSFIAYVKSAITFGVLDQQMFQISEGTGEVLQSVLQVEVFFFQSADGILELIGWAAVWKQRNQPQSCGDLQNREHCILSEEVWLDATQL